MTEDRLGEPEVFQREYISTQRDKDQFVQTIGVYTCVALVIFDPNTKKAILAHLDPSTNIDKELPRLTRDISFKNSEISMLGGVVGDLGFFDRVKLKVESLDGVVFRLAHNKRGSMGMNLRLNLNNGDLSRYSESRRSTPSGVASAKADRMRFVSSKLFRHEASIGGGDVVIPASDSNSIPDFLRFETGH